MGFPFLGFFVGEWRTGLGLGRYYSYQWSSVNLFKYLRAHGVWSSVNLFKYLRAHGVMGVRGHCALAAMDVPACLRSTRMPCSCNDQSM